MAPSKQQTLSRFFNVKKKDKLVIPGRVILESSSKVPSASEAVNSCSSSPIEVIPSDGPNEKSSVDQFRFNSSSTEIAELTPARKELRDKYIAKLSTLSKRTEMETEEGESSEIEEPKTKKSKSSKSKLTPLETQYVALKKQHTDKILAYQVGYKYKFFCEDARIVAPLLNIMFIPGRMSFDDSNPQDLNYSKFAYCSIPDNRLHIHLKKILAANHKVGVVEQIETSAIKQNSSNKNSVFERRLTNVYTKSTYIDDDDLESGRGETILSVRECESMIYLVSVNPFTGSIVYDSFLDNPLRDELDTRISYLEPKEFVLIGDVSKNTTALINKYNNLRITKTAYRGPVFYNSELTNQFDYQMVEFLISFHEDLQCCVYELVSYLKEFDLSNVFGIRDNYASFIEANHMILNANTLNSLEVFQNQTDYTEKGSLYWLLDNTRTPFGKRMLKNWVGKPLVDREHIEERSNAINDIKSNYNYSIESFMRILTHLPDLERGLIRIHYGKAKRKEVYLILKGFQEILTLAKRFTNNNKDFKSDLLVNILDTLNQASSEETIQNLINMIIISTAMDDKDHDEQRINFFNLSFHQWDMINIQQENIKEVEQELNEELASIRKMLKRPALAFVTVSREEYLIEVMNSIAKTLPKDWLKISGTKTVSRFRSPQIISLLKKLQLQREMLLHACDQSYKEYLNMIDSNYAYLNSIIKSVAKFDCLVSLSAASSISPGYVKPALVDSQIIDVKQGRNPLIEQLSSSNYIANDIFMSREKDRALLITGPNMGGKSSYVRQVALIVIMAHIGCYVPAESATIGIFDSIFTRMGAQDNIFRGESTFMVEMNECQSILEKATSKSLVILDEIGRGTGTIDGISLAYSILDYLITSDKSPLTLFITHYPSLHSFEETYKPLVKNYHMNYIEERNQNHDWPIITFLYTLGDGVVNNSYGLNVARLASIPDEVIDRAYTASLKIRNDIEVSNNDQWAIELMGVLTNLKEGDVESKIKILEKLSST